MKYLVLSVICFSLFVFSNCNKDDHENAVGTYSFSITCKPEGKTQYSKKGTGEVSVAGNTLYVNVEMSTGEKYSRKGEFSEEDIIIKGTYTQPMASDPSVDETVTYDGEGTFDGEFFHATGTYTHDIPDYGTEDEGTFEISATKKE